WLRREATGSHAAVALEEIAQRQAAKRLSDEQVRALVSDALAAQADLERPWQYRWGDLVERAHQAGLVTPEQWEAYAKNAVTFTLMPRARVRVGDATP